MYGQILKWHQFCNYMFFLAKKEGTKCQKKTTFVKIPILRTTSPYVV